MQKWGNWEAATELDWLSALRRESVIAPLAAQSKVGLRRGNEAALQLGLRRSVIYDLLKRYRQRSQTSTLLPCNRGREPEVPVLKEVREQLLSSHIQDFYLQPERPRLAALAVPQQVLSSGIKVHQLLKFPAFKCSPTTSNQLHVEECSGATREKEHASQ